MKNKRGISHIEFILSFIIFLGFLIFLFYFLNPFKKTEFESSLLDSVIFDVKSNLSVLLITEPFSINKSIGIGSCFSIDKFEGVDKNVTVRDERGNQVLANKAGERVLIEKSSGRFYIVYYSDGVDEKGKLTNCTKLNETDYSIGVIREHNPVSIEKIKKFKKDYEEYYESLKKGFHIPASNDFSVIIYSMNNTEIIRAEKKIPEGIDIFVKERGIKVLYEDGRIVNSIMQIKIW